MLDRPPAEVPAWVHRLPALAGTVTALLAATMLVGWWRDFASLIDVLPSLPRMKANTAFAALAAGLSLLGRPTGRAWWQRTLSLVVLAVGTATLVEWVLGRSLGIDELLVEDVFTHHHPGRTSPQLASAMVLFALARLTNGSPRRVTSLVGGTLTTLFAAMALLLELGYLFRAPELTATDEAAGMAMASAAAILMLTVGLLATTAERRPLSYLWHHGLTGTLSRRLLPAVILLPPGLGLARLLGQERDWYGASFGAAAFTGSMIVVLAAVVAVTARTMAVAEAEADLATRALRDAEQRARYLADHDPLTEVWNRRRFELELDAALGTAAQEARPGGAVMIVDVDHFKVVNDTLGHSAGDELLVAVARDLDGCVGTRGSVSRIGGDEFAVLLPEAGPEEVEQVAREVVATVACSGSERLRSTGLVVSASVGVALFDEPGKPGARRSLLTRADEAMYDAKRTGRGRYVMHDVAVGG
ncbi:MAG TPA: GGDEF domain-containing protein [Nocardioides sp.]|nr:GGDEF domain-containing protein [Nocardioides sp.]